MSFFFGETTKPPWKKKNNMCWVELLRRISDEALCLQMQQSLGARGGFFFTGQEAGSEKSGKVWVSIMGIY